MDLFGRKKRKAERIEVYQDMYRRMGPDQRGRHRNFLEQKVIHGIFRNRAVSEMLTAAFNVATEEETK